MPVVPLFIGYVREIVFSSTFVHFGDILEIISEVALKEERNKHEPSLVGSNSQSRPQYLNCEPGSGGKQMSK
jgi:hypothetical protein